HELQMAVQHLLADLDVRDSHDAFAAIRLSNAGGLGSAGEQDVRGEPTLPLRQIMALAADRDMIARQYANGFREIFDDGLPALLSGLEETNYIEGAIIRCFLRLMAKHSDTLIARKRNQRDANSASRWAQKVLDEGWPTSGASWESFASFDAWL